ncbi:MAG: glycosyltransferase family 39 protein [Chloroflexota bacterium]|nr:glycosyltransferase family 39 protein [Chloroflexota bacterium]
MLTLLNRHKLLLLIIIAVLVRMGVLIALYPSLFAFEQTGAIHGSGAYDSYALNLLVTGVYGKGEPGVPDAHLPPLYSYFLAGVYSIFGRSGLAVGAAHIALDMVTLVCLYYLCKRIAGEVVACLACLFFAGYPYLLFQNLTLIDTPLFMALLYAWLLAMIVLRERARFDRTTLLLALGAGVLLGLLALGRTNVVLLAPLVGLWFLFRLPLRAAVARLLPVALVSLLTITPWIVRNYGVYGQFVAISLNGGENFYQGSNRYVVPYFTAGYDVQWVPPPDGMEAAVGMTPERNAALMVAGWRYLNENPSAIPELLWTKFLVHWSIDVAPARNPTAGEAPRIDYQGDTIRQTDGQGDLQITGLPPGDPVDVYSESLFDVVGRLLHRVYYGGLFALALVGSVAAWRQWRTVSLIWLVQFGMTFSYVLFHPATRYRAPTDPLLFALSAYALVALWAWWKGRSK